MDSISKGSIDKEALIAIAKKFLDILPQSMAIGLRKTVEETFLCRPGELVRYGASEGRVSIEVRDSETGCGSELEFVFKGDTIHLGGYKWVGLDDYLKKLDVKVYPRNLVVARIGDVEISSKTIKTTTDLIDFALDIVLSYFAIGRALLPFFGGEPVSALFVDGRAGILRTLYRPYLHPLVARNVMEPDERFTALSFRLAEYLANGLIDVDVVKSFAVEMGFEPEVVFEYGKYVLYAKMWTGVRIPLFKSPSGVRESLLPVLALASSKDPYVVIVEEPEAHLHPRAQRLLAKVIAKAVNRGKIVVLTTHSDYILYCINNLIALSSKEEKAKELGYAEDEVIDPDDVAAYLLRAEKMSTVVEKLSIGPEGVDESEFSKIAEELAFERAKILA